MGYADYFERQVSQGFTGAGRTPFNQRYSPTLRGEKYDLINSDVDRLWAAGQRDTAAPHSYFDYYFSGQDMKVYLDGTEDDPEYGNLPMMNLGFEIAQQKQALYGFWSYTSDQVMRGTRRVRGSFTLATKSPDYMTRLLSKAAKARSDGKRSYRYHRDLTEDDRNIEQYWGKNMDKSVGSSGGKQIFSVHPPFSLVILYGIQNLSINEVSSSGYSEVWDKYQSDNPLALDINERLVESDPLWQANRIVIDQVELDSFQAVFSPDGQPVAETWTWEARDVVIPPRVTGATGAILAGVQPRTPSAVVPPNVI